MRRCGTESLTSNWEPHRSSQNVLLHDCCCCKFYAHSASMSPRDSPSASPMDSPSTSSEDSPPSSLIDSPSTSSITSPSKSSCSTPAVNADRSRPSGPMRLKEDLNPAPLRWLCGEASTTGAGVGRSSSARVISACSNLFSRSNTSDVNTNLLVRTHCTKYPPSLPQLKNCFYLLPEHMG